MASPLRALNQCATTVFALPTTPAAAIWEHTKSMVIGAGLAERTYPDGYALAKDELPVLGAFRYQ